MILSVQNTWWTGSSVNHAHARRAKVSKGEGTMRQARRASRHACARADLPPPYSHKKRNDLYLARPMPRPFPTSAVTAAQAQSAAAPLSMMPASRQCRLWRGTGARECRTVSPTISTRDRSQDDNYGVQGAQCANRDTCAVRIAGLLRSSRVKGTGPIPPTAVSEADLASSGAEEEEKAEFGDGEQTRAQASGVFANASSRTRLQAH